jgi:small redox-active disulfide protein 2
VKRLIIEWQRLLDEQKQTCPRCGSTEQEVEKAVQELNRLLKQSDIVVNLTKKAIDPVSFKKDALQSNKILIAGKTLEDWLEAKTGQSKCCETCGDAECRTVEYAEETHEAIPAELVARAGLIAVSQVFGVKLPETTQRKPVAKVLFKKRKGRFSKEGFMEIKVLGPGCANCHKMDELAKTAVKELGIEAKIEKITDIGQIAMHGILSTPGLIVNGKIKHSGKPLPSLEKVKELIKAEE